MRFSLISFLLLIMFSSYSFSQSTWSRVFPEISSAGQRCVTEVIECPNGDLVCAGGNGNRYGAANAFLMRIDSTGSQVWYKEYPGFHSLVSVELLDSGGFIAGGIGNTDTYSTSCILKVDSSGNVIQAVEVEIEYLNNITSIVKSPNGFIVMVNVALELNNALTSTNWTSRLQPNGYTNDIEAVPGGFIVLGSGGLVSPYDDIHLTKIDSIGNPIWSMCHGGPETERALDVEPTLDGGYLVGGWTYSFDSPNAKYFMVKTDSVGNYEWGKTYNHAVYGNFSYCVLEDDAGNFYIGGAHQSNNVMIIKTDSDGNFIWSKTFHPGTAYSMIQSSDGNIVVAGETAASDYFVFKMDTSGNTFCSEDVSIDEFDRPFQSQTSYSNPGAVSNLYQETIIAESYTKEHFSCQFLITDEISGFKNESLIQVYPNPASDFVQFKFAELTLQGSLEIYTIQGELIQVVEIEEGVEQKTLSTLILPSGIYMYSFMDKNGMNDRGRFMVKR